MLGVGCFSFFAMAASKTITLIVPGMHCSACVTTIKKALEKVEGVEKVQVTYESKKAVVTFDDAKTKAEALQKATKDAGYPSAVTK